MDMFNLELNLWVAVDSAMLSTYIHECRVSGVHGDAIDDDAFDHDVYLSIYLSIFLPFRPSYPCLRLSLLPPF